MSAQIARQMLAGTAGRFRVRNIRNSALPDHWLLGQRASGPNALETLLQWATDIAVQSAVERASLYAVNNLQGLRQWGLVQYRYAPFPETVEMTVEFTYPDGTLDQFSVIARRIVRELPLGGQEIRVSVDVSGSNQVRNFAAAHEDGIEKLGRPSGRVIILASTSPSRPAPAPVTSAPQAATNAPRTPAPGAVLPPGFIYRDYQGSMNTPPTPARGIPPNYIFRDYPGSTNTPQTPTPARVIPPNFLMRDYPSSASAPRRHTGHPLGR